MNQTLWKRSKIVQKVEGARKDGFETNTPDRQKKVVDMMDTSKKMNVAISKSTNCYLYRLGEVSNKITDG